MPIPNNSALERVANSIANNISHYNTGNSGPRYNRVYRDYIDARNAGIASFRTLSGWIANRGAESAIRELLIAYGMDARKSQMISTADFHVSLRGLPAASIDWIMNQALPLCVSPARSKNPVTGNTLAVELSTLYNTLKTPGAVTKSGGYVAASKTMHCLFPDLVPMIDGTHTGISYYHITRETYCPPLCFVNWTAWIGHSIRGVPNPSPRGYGRYSWGADQFLAAIGLSQHLFEIWDANNGNAGISGFLRLDPTPGTTGIPRIVDKGLW